MAAQCISTSISGLDETDLGNNPIQAVFQFSGLSEALSYDKNGKYGTVTIDPCDSFVKVIVDNVPVWPGGGPTEFTYGSHTAHATCTETLNDPTPGFTTITLEITL